MKKCYLIISRITVILFIIAILILLGYVAINIRDWKMTSKCRDAINLVESYRNQHGYLPRSLSEVQFKNSDGSDEIYYDLLNDSVYTISYMYSIDYNKFYYSDTQTWHKGLR